MISVACLLPGSWVWEVFFVFGFSCLLCFLFFFGGGGNVPIRHSAFATFGTFFLGLVDGVGWVVSPVLEEVVTDIAVFFTANCNSCSSYVT